LSTICHEQRKGWPVSLGLVFLAWIVALLTAVNAMQQLGINQAEETTVVVASMPTGNYKNHLQSTDKRKV